MRNSKTTKELYEKLIQMPDLHSKPELDGEILIWKLYETAYVRAYCDSYDTCIEIVGTSVGCPSTHWHPEAEDMQEILYNIGKKGNVLVLRKIILGTQTYYLGSPEKYRFDKNKKWHLGRLIYLEQKTPQSQETTK